MLQSPVDAFDTNSPTLTFVCPLLLPLVVVGNGAAMYAMVCIDIDKFDDKIIDDISFMKLLLEEEIRTSSCIDGVHQEIDKRWTTSQDYQM